MRTWFKRALTTSRVCLDVGISSTVVEVARGVHRDPKEGQDIARSLARFSIGSFIMVPAWPIERQETSPRLIGFEVCVEREHSFRLFLKTFRYSLGPYKNPCLR